MKALKRIAFFALTALSTFLLGVSIAGVGFVSLWGADTVPAQRLELPPWQALLSFENQDLGSLDQRSARVVQGAIDAITGPAKPNRLPFFPRLFRTITNTKGEQRYILVEESPLLEIPDRSELRVHVFDTSGHLLSGEEFGAGWRTVLIGMNIRKILPLAQEALVVNGEYCFGGHPSRQYYVVIGNRISLVYLETDGQFERNSYQYSNVTIGPTFRERSADDWEKALCSTDDAEVLSALMWLNGNHWNGEPPPYDEDKSEAEKVSTLRSRDSVRKVLAELTRSPNSWIQIAGRREVTN